jgi:predicted acetyltransferase
LGGQLLKQVLKRADDEKVPVYLESSNPKNLDFYRKYGFEVTDEIVPIAGCPPIWGLFRASQSGKKASKGRKVHSVQRVAHPKIAERWIGF